jgi:hypothetical protein
MMLKPETEHLSWRTNDVLRARLCAQQATPVKVSVFEPVHDSGYDSNSNTELTSKDGSDTESTDQNKAIDSQLIGRCPYSRQLMANSIYK